ncbi:hypothetical protein BBJ28_00007565, partial [Nothophytophthora sp. Chile5]
PASILNPAPPSASKLRISSLTTIATPEPSPVVSRFSIAEEEQTTVVSPPARTGSVTGTSLFHEMPTSIQSFADTERRRVDAIDGNGVNAGGSGNSNSEAKNDVQNGSTSGNNAKNAVSMYEFFFPEPRGRSNGNESNGATAAALTTGSNRSLKRKRRSGRRADELTGSVEIDLLRFGVDSVKLVPQGLVDRVDAKMSHSLLARVVGCHVDNWCKRAGFAASFLQELTTLLAAYYPCGYPTLLDEVLAGFLFKRPEFIDVLLPAMLDKMLKSGESVSPGKYPVADALVRNCAPRPVLSRARVDEERGRHELACLTLLQCLTERNGDRFVLSPCIAACALECSDAVLQSLWRALLFPMLPAAAPIEDGKSLKPTWVESIDLHWRIEDPAQQMVELLAEEDRQRACRLTCAFVDLLLRDDVLKTQLVDAESYLVPQCLERAFTHASTGWSASVLGGWLERQRQRPADKAMGGAAASKAFEELVAFFVRFNTKLIVKKSDWFAKHVVRFVLSPQCRCEEQERLLRAILCKYMPFVLGGVDAEERQYERTVAKGQVLEQKSTQNGSNGAAPSSGVIWAALDAVETHSVTEVVSKLKLLLSILDAAGGWSSSRFMDLWTELWSESTATVPWSYVHALLSVVIQETAEEDTYQDPLALKLQSLTTQVCGTFFRHLVRHPKGETSDKVTATFSEALNWLLPSTRPIAQILLAEIVNALTDYEKTNSALSCMIFGNAVALHLAGDGNGGVGLSGKRGVVQKPSVDYDRLPASPAVGNTSLCLSNADVQVFSTLKKLASRRSEAGDFVRRVLSTRPLVRLLMGLLNSGRRRRRQELLLDVMDAVVTGNTSTELNGNWARQHVVQEIVYCAYSTPFSVSRRATVLLQNLLRRSWNGGRALLWVILQQCTKYCCGCEDKENVAVVIPPSDNFQGTAGIFAELVKVMLTAVPAITMHEVLNFVEQKLSSCSAGETRLNLFLLLLLRKLVLGELHCSAFLPALQLAVCPLAASNLDQIRLLQLQLLKALCSRLIAARRRRVAPKRIAGKTARREGDSDWARCEDLVCSERLQSDLRAIVTPSLTSGGAFHRQVDGSSRASVGLAQGILTVVRQLKRDHDPIIDEDDGIRV